MITRMGELGYHTRLWALISMSHALFSGIYTTRTMSVHALSLLSCVHLLGLGLDLGNSLDRRESAHALTHESQSFQIKKGRLILNVTPRPSKTFYRHRTFPASTVFEQLLWGSNGNIVVAYCSFYLTTQSI